MSNTPAIWRPAPRPRNWPSCWWMRAKGVQVQTRRHSFIVSLLGIRHLVLAINKMDFGRVRSGGVRTHLRRLSEFAAQLGWGKSIASRCRRCAAITSSNLPPPCPGMTGRPCSTLLEQVDRNCRPQPARFPLSGAVRQSAPPGFSRVLRHHRRRGGPTGRRSGGVAFGPALAHRRHRDHRGRKLTEAQAGQAVTLTLRDEIDVSRGDLLVHPDRLPAVADRLRRPCGMDGGCAVVAGVGNTISSWEPA